MRADDTVVAHVVHVRPRPRAAARHGGARRAAVFVRCMWLVALVIALLAWAPVQALAAPSGEYAAIDWQNVTIAEWQSLFAAARDSWALPRLYSVGPRVRVKLVVAQRLSMTELISGEGILTQRVSELVGVAAARVQIEYIETTATRAEDRGAYSLSLGVSALVDPDNSSSSARMAPLIDDERMRIIQCLRFGCVVRDQNVTISSLNLFGSAMRLLDIALDGEAFYPLDLTPWVEARLVIATESAASGASSTAVVPSTGGGSSSSSITPAIENLLLRFAIAQTLSATQLSSSSIVVRDSWNPPGNVYNRRQATIVPIEIHQLSILRIERRQWQVVDATRSFLAARLPPGKPPIDAITVGGIEFVPLDVGVVPSTGTIDPFQNSDVSSDPLNAPTVKLSLVLTVLPRDGVDAAAAVDVLDIDAVFQSAQTDAVDLRVTLGFVDFDDAQALQNSAVAYSNAALWPTPTATPDGVDTVDVTLTIAESSARSFSEPLARLDAFGVHRIRAAMQLLVQQVFVNREDTAIVSFATGAEFGARSTTARCRFLLSIRDDAQRAGIARVLQTSNAWRLRSTVQTYTQQQYQIARLELDSSPLAQSRVVMLPGTSLRVARPTPSVNLSLVDLDSHVTRVRFADPMLVDDKNASDTGLPSSCPPPAAGRHELCFRFELATTLPHKTLIIRQVSFPEDVMALVNDQPLHPDSPALSAPWAQSVPDLDSASPDPGALLRFHSAASRVRVPVQIVMEFVDVEAYYPAFVVNMDLSLQSSTLADAVVRSQPSRLMRPSNPNFQSSIAFLLEYRNGQTRTQQLPNFASVIDVAGVLQDVLTDLFGSRQRGMSVRPTFRPGNETQPAVVQIEYHFLDTTAASLPFISVVAGDAAVIETTTSKDALFLTATP
ncbi:hypothetical protein P43SY_000320 [Pythium insidiosum]|uniref:Uncharacterized protein n=1 Tax=Pythium insidiosum TaxID=114742 RepID=A0AAD5Q1W8_PYTIN|nr:hypothetical protein P43SY_000320 [Pythium insidiosum]